MTGTEEELNLAVKDIVDADRQLNPNNTHNEITRNDVLG